MVRGPVRKPQRWLWRLLVFTIAWQAFAYGWSITTAEYVEKWPQVRASLDFAAAWTTESQAPLAHFLDWLAGSLTGRIGRPGWLHVHLMAYGTFLLHAFLVSLGLVIAGRGRVSTSAPYWGYILSAWNPFLMVQVVYHQWPLILGLVLLALAFLWTGKERWWYAILAFWAANLVHAQLVLLWPVVFAPLWRRRHERWRIAFWVPGLVLWTGFGVVIGSRDFGAGWYRLWWGQGSWPEIGWSAFSFMRLVPLQGTWAGLLSLLTVLVLNGALVYFYVRRWVTLRMLPVTSAWILWLFYWRAQFYEVGLALYWLGLWLAHQLPVLEDRAIPAVTQSPPAMEPTHGRPDPGPPAQPDE